MWASKAPAPMSRRSAALPSLFLSNNQTVCVWEENGGECYLFPGEGVLRFALRKVGLSVPSPVISFSETFSDHSSVVSIGATERATLTTVGRVRILVGSHGSYGESALGKLTDHPSPDYPSHPAIHPCTDLCHAPGSCQETESCTATVIITCSCGRIRQSVQCGRKLSNPAGGEGGKILTCTNECAVAKRNARLAEALGISSDRAEKNKATYRDELVAFARANSKFIPVVEKSLAEYDIHPSFFSTVFAYTHFT